MSKGYLMLFMIKDIYSDNKPFQIEREELKHSKEMGTITRIIFLLRTQNFISLD